MNTPTTETIYEQLGISKEVWAFGQKTEEKLKERFEEFDRNAEYNQLKVVKAMQDNRVSAVVLVLLLSRLVVVGEDVREEHSVLLLQTAEHRPVDYGHVFKLLHLLYQVGFDLEAGCILVVGDTAAGVSALAGKLDAAVLLEVELNAVLLLQAHNIGGSLLDEYLYVVEIVLVVPCDEGILYMKLVAVIFLVHNSRNASLGKRGVAQRKLSFAKH